MFTESQS